VTLRATDLEPIKTAMVEGNLARARKLRTQLLRDIIQELRDEWPEYSNSPPRRLNMVENMLDALGIPEEE
jgi:hypothetical protein